MAVFSQTSWQGGIVNDEYLADATQFSDCADVNIYESSGYFKLSPQRTATNLTDWQNYYCSTTGKNSAGSTITYIAGTVWGWSEWIFALASAPATYNTTSGSKWKILATWIVWNRAWTGTGTGFIITHKWGLYIWSYDASASLWNFTNAWLTNKKANDATYTTEYIPQVLFWEFLYYWFKNEVRCFETINWIEQFEAGWSSWAILTIDASYEITHISYQWATVSIWANNWTDSKKYIWDGVSSEASEIIDYKNKRVDAVANFGNYEIALYKTLNQYSVWTVEWYDMKPLYSSDYPYNTDKRGFQTYITPSVGTLALGDNIMAFVKDAFYIHVLGNFKPWKPLALSKLSHDNGGTVNLVQWDGFINSIYSNASSSLWYKTAYSASSFTSSGYIITNPIRGTSLAIRKTCKKIMYWYELQTWSTIKIYYQLNKNDTEQGSTNWTLLDTITVGSDFAVWNGYRAKSMDGTFNQIRFKIQIETSNASYSPKLFDFHFEYDETSAEL